MPYNEARKRWRAVVKAGGRRHTAIFESRRAALEWENDKRRELRAPPRSRTPTGSLLQAATEYLDFCERTFNPTTFSNKRKALKELMSITGNIALSDVDPGLILNRVIMTQKTPSLANERRKHLHSFFEHCRRFSGLRFNPVAEIPKQAVDRRPQAVPTEEEFLKLLMAASRHDRNLLVCCAATGGRRSEILALTWTADVNFQERTIRLCNRKNRTRELRCRTVPMNDELCKALQDQLATRLPESDYVFQNRAVWASRDGRVIRKHPNYGQRYTARRRFMAGLCKRAGVKKRIGFHALRRYFASMLADNREKLPTIQALLGHAAVSTTDRYVHRLKDDTRLAVNKLSLRGPA
jgi:integrase